MDQILVYIYMAYIHIYYYMCVVYIFQAKTSTLTNMLPLNWYAFIYLCVFNVCTVKFV